MPRKAKYIKPIGPVWVLRWLGPYGVAYIGMEPKILDAKDRRRHVVFEVAQATLYPTRDDAEGAAVILSAKYPEWFIGKLDPRVWDGRKKRP